MPVYNNSSALVYYDIAPSSHGQVNNNSWEDWDMSAFIPVGAVYVQVHTDNLLAESQGIREKGSALARITTSPFSCLCRLSTARVVQTYAPAGRAWYCTGYWI